MTTIWKHFSTASQVGLATQEGSNAHDFDVFLAVGTLLVPYRLL